jgi:hypothetical protein
MKVHSEYRPTCVSTHISDEYKYINKDFFIFDTVKFCKKKKKTYNMLPRTYMKY